MSGRRQAGGRRRAPFWAAVVSAVLAAALAALWLASSAGTVTVRVENHRQFQAAVKELRTSGGTIVLLPHVYTQPLVVGRRGVAPLRIIGSPGVRIERLELQNTRSVSVGGITIAPVAHNAWLRVSGSERIVLHDLVVTAHRTRLSAGVEIPDSSRVVIRNSRFTRCGDQAPKWTNCLRVQRWAKHILVERNWFHDCRGCDFIHGRFRADFTIRNNRFERALPCRLNETQMRRTRRFLPQRSAERCGHQDLIELFGGNGLRVEDNHFGVYRGGGAQVYLTGTMDHVTIANNVFVGSDPRLPLYRSRVGLLIGARGAPHVPLHVKVFDNTILTGARRADGYMGSIAMSPAYQHLPRLRRPLIVNNVIGVLKTPARVCRGAQSFRSNIVIEGMGCGASEGAARLASVRDQVPGSTLPLDFRAIVDGPWVGVPPP